MFSATITEVQRPGATVLKRVAKLCSLDITVGFNDTGEIHPTSDLLMAEHAALLVFGNPAMQLPARDFMRTTFFRYHSTILRYTYLAAEEVVKGRMPVRAAAVILGESYANLIKRNVYDGDFPAISAMTAKIKAQRGSAHPNDVLLDTEAMVDAIDSEVF